MYDDYDDDLTSFFINEEYFAEILEGRQPKYFE
jgi:hypothetical protein